MKIKIITVGILGCLIGQYMASAAILPVCSASMCTTSIPVSNVISNCSNYSDNCYNGTKIRTCNTCNTGYTRTQQTTNVSTCTGTIQYYNCVSGSGGGIIEPIECDGTCDNCTSGFWIASGTAGYQKRTVATCNTSTCECTRTIKYRCAAGYYGTPPEIQLVGNLTGCSECPPTSDAATRTSPAGTTAITGCYISSGTSFSDTSGDGTYTNKCNYTN